MGSVLFYHFYEVFRPTACSKRSAERTFMPCATVVVRNRPHAGGNANSDVQHDLKRLHNDHKCQQRNICSID